MEHRGRRQPDQPGEEKGYGEQETLNTHVFIHTRFLAGVNFASRPSIRAGLVPLV